MPPRKRSRDDEFVAAEPAEATQGCPLPAELLLEIVARTDAATVLRCAASCRSLRRDILHPGFIHRVCNVDGVVPPSLLGFLGLESMPPPYASMPPPSFSLAYPATPAAASLSEKHLAPFLSRSSGADAGRLAGYRILTSRDGLVLLRRIYFIGTTREVTMCVYDAMTGKGTFFPGPPGTPSNYSYFSYDKFVLLTAADGVGCPFLVFSADFSGRRTCSLDVMVRTFSPSDSDGGAWCAAAFAIHSRRQRHAIKAPCDSIAVLHGGLIHWLVHGGEQDFYIFTYNVITAASGWVELPSEVPAECRAKRKLHLTSSPANGRQLLSLLVVHNFKISVWLRSDDGAWARHADIDTTRTMYSVALVGHNPLPITADVVGFGARSNVVILLSHLMDTWSWREFVEVEEGIIILDLETKEMRVVSKKKHAFLYEIDMASRLSAMKNF